MATPASPPTLPPVPPVPLVPPARPAPHAALTAHALRVGYGPRAVLHDVNLQVAHGEIRVVLGGSGCGKSTLLRHLVGLLTPQAGDITLLGQSLGDATAAQRQALLRRIGVLFQSGALLNALTVADNVALPLRERRDYPQDFVDEVVRHKLAMVGLAHAGHLMPPVLSGGMRKRVALARAMALDPEILFCDEPSAGLDPTAAADLDRLLLGLREQFGTTLVVVTHELASIHAIADRILMLEGGRVVADGALGELQAVQTPAMRRFFARQPTLDVAFATSLHTALCGAPGG